MVNAVERNVKLLVHVDEKIQIMGQGDQMVQLVLIIGDNALKYTPENGTVTFVTELQQDGSVKMTISDQGPGIPEEDLPFIWERFYKVDKSHSRNVPGTGLGLAIAREIIRMHGAKVQVFSKLGEGTNLAKARILKLHSLKIKLFRSDWRGKLETCVIADGSFGKK